MPEPLLNLPVEETNASSAKLYLNGKVYTKKDSNALTNDMLYCYHYECDRIQYLIKSISKTNELDAKLLYNIGDENNNWINPILAFTLATSDYYEDENRFYIVSEIPEGYTSLIKYRSTQKNPDKLERLAFDVANSLSSALDYIHTRLEFTAYGFINPENVFVREISNENNFEVKLAISEYTVNINSYMKKVREVPKCSGYCDYIDISDTKLSYKSDLYSIGIIIKYIFCNSVNGAISNEFWKQISQKCIENRYADFKSFQKEVHNYKTKKRPHILSIALIFSAVIITCLILFNHNETVPVSVPSSSSELSGQIEYPENNEDLYKYALAKMKQGSYKVAYDAAESFCAEFPDYKETMDAQILMAEALLNLGDFTKLYSSLSDIESKSTLNKSQKAKCEYLWGEYWLFDNNYTIAFNHFEAADKYEPNNSLYTFKIITTLLEMNESTTELPENLSKKYAKYKNSVNDDQYLDYINACEMAASKQYSDADKSFDEFVNNDKYTNMLCLQGAYIKMMDIAKFVYPEKEAFLQRQKDIVEMCNESKKCNQFTQCVVKEKYIISCYIYANNNGNPWAADRDKVAAYLKDAMTALDELNTKGYASDNLMSTMAGIYMICADLIEIPKIEDENYSEKLEAVKAKKMGYIQTARNLISGYINLKIIKPNFIIKSTQLKLELVWENLSADTDHNKIDKLYQDACAVYEMEISEMDQNSNIYKRYKQEKTSLDKYMETTEPLYSVT